MLKRTSHKKRPLTSRNADRHILYQASVQGVETEAAFLARTFKKVRGRDAVSLREDFCGTALLCSEWVKKKGRTAVGVDLDPEVLAWGKRENLAPLGKAAERVKLLQQDVRAPVAGRFDLAVALNFSYFVFRTRDDLRSYFRSVRRTMKKDGLFFVDLYGGYDSFRPMREKRRVGGFVYVWDQAAVDPIDHSVVNHIHFEFKNGSKLRKAFTYEWRIWTIPEIRELLAEAGFSETTAYWEDGGADGSGTGVFRPRSHVDQEAAWVAYVMASP